MNRLDEQYQEQDSLEERRIIFAIIIGGISVLFIASVILNIILLVQIGQLSKLIAQ